MKDVGLWDQVAASRDAVAVEAWGAQRFGIDPGELPSIGLCEELGLGKAVARGDAARVREV
jgi:hypothetical protein